MTTIHPFPNPVRAHEARTLGQQLEWRPFIRSAPGKFVEFGFDLDEPTAVWQRVLQTRMAVPVSSLVGLNLIYDAEVLWVGRDGRLYGGLHEDGDFIRNDNDWMTVVPLESTLPGRRPESGPGPGLVQKARQLIGRMTGSQAAS